MKKPRKWEIQADGRIHTIEYKQDFGFKIIVDGETHKVKPSGRFSVLIDYEISFGDTDCKLVVINNNADLAVNGVFLGSKKPYQPISNIPSWVWVLVGLSIIGGLLIFGIYGFLIGFLMHKFYIKNALEKKTGHIIGYFIACTIFQASISFLQASLLH